MNKLYPLFLAPPAAIGLLILRIVAGLGLMFHGWTKIQNPFGWMGADAWAPGFLQALAAVAEFGGGLCLLLGLLTPIACLGIIAVMLTAVFSVHLPKGDRFVGRGAGASWELAALYFSIASLYLFCGPGILSVDNGLFKKPRVSNAPVDDRIKTGVR